MSEIAKCPNCDGTPVVGRYSGFISCCAVKVDANNLGQSTKIWNQYAAAMKLAKLTVQMKTCRAYCPERAFLYAQDRVLGVFNE
jgi:Pyruvate/2-oxoacid:ferredoxin oxidoreductase delta subunit